MNEPTQTYLIKECRKGNRNAQVEIYKKYAQKVYVACLRIVGNPAEAEEAMQDAFLKVFTRLDQYKDERNFEVWMHTIAVHTAIDYVRRQQESWLDLNEHTVAEPEEEVNEEEITYTVQQIKETVTRLPAGYRVILSLYLFEGYDMEEIASILKIKPPSVRSQYLRAKRKLIELISLN